MSQLKLLFKFILITSFMSCNYNDKKGLAEPGASLSKLAFAADQKIDFEIVKKTSLTVCLNCHAGNKSPNLTSLPEIQQKKDLIWHEVDSRSMPPAGTGNQELAGCEKELLRKWIDIGAPETSTVLVSEVAECAAVNTDPKQDPKPDLTPILLMPLNYKSLTDKILKPKCLLCHSMRGDDQDAKVLPFYPYESLVSLQLWDAPAKTSKVLDEIINKEDGMPPPESKMGSLTDDEIEFIRRWIDAGKPEL